MPGWGIDCDCEPRRPAEPSLEVYNLRADVHIGRSIVDAADGEREAIGAPASAAAHVFLTMRRSTVFGIVEVHAMKLAENCLFMHCVNVARRQLGCLRYC
ncbi:MAG: hypothetical protein ACREUF_01045, partial [Solimonas sp.]